MWNNPNDHDEGSVPISFNVNSDIALPKFWSNDRTLSTFLLIAMTVATAALVVERSSSGWGIIIKSSVQGGPHEEQTLSAPALGCKYRRWGKKATRERPL